jgi:PucR C-terminal helix-turn-helix domain
LIVVRAHARQPEQCDWRARVLAAAERAARRVATGALGASIEGLSGRRRGGPERDVRGRAGAGGEGELVIVVPGAETQLAERAATAVLRELESGFPRHGFVVARSRHISDAADLYRAGAEALLAANVAEARGEQTLAFEETVSYLLLLSSVSDDPEELERFYAETIAPLVAYDDQYETALLRTLETYLDSDASVAGTAQRLFTHRHTVRYRLERVRELTSLDVGSSEGRERLGLGLKAMRVLGLAPPAGPATERGAEGGRVPREDDKG